MHLIPSRATRTAAAIALVSLMAGACSNGAEPTAAAADGSPDPTVVQWFVGLGTGSSSGQLATQRAVVDSFNDSHTDIQLELEVVDNSIAYELLETRIAAGDPPDIIGPVGVRGVNAFDGQFLDLTPYIEAQDIDLTVFDPRQVEVWREDDGSLTALPFGAFPSFLYYNVDLFDRAGLPYPPHRFGELYNGAEWTMDALHDTALLLTLDRGGNNATSPDFDPDHIVQWGFHHQYVGDARAQGSFFAAGSFLADDGTAQIPPAWLAEWQWYHDLIFADHAAPSQNEIDSPLLDSGNTFASGNMAMVFSHLWYTGSLRASYGDGSDFFDIAVVPSYDGNITSKVHADTFRILESTPHPEAAFDVLAYLTDDAAGDLLAIYGSLPARSELRDAFFDELDATFPQSVDWSVVEASLAYPDIPHHEAAMPDVDVAEARIDEFEVLLTTDPDLDVAAEAERLRVDLDVIFAGADG